MRLKSVSKRTFLLIIFTGLIFSPVFLFFRVPKIQTPIKSVPTFVTEQSAIPFQQVPARAGLPVRLKIPSINVDSAVEHVALTSQGAMDVPKNPAAVAWYNLGPRPGERGSSVIAGHYDTKKGAPAVFSELHALQKGDKIYIESGDGVITTFVVREIKKYNWNASATDVFGSNDEDAHLNLVTCEGAWNKSAKNYSNRLVVFADKE